MATLASSPSLETSLVSSLRRSSLRGGNTRPDDLAVVLGVHAQVGGLDGLLNAPQHAHVPGWMVSTRASVTETAASWLMGVGVS